MKIRLILKGILFYTTLLSVILFICGADSIYDNGYFLYSVIVCALLIYLCCKFISVKDSEILSGNKWFDKFIK